MVGEAETDKAVVDIPAPSDGKVKELKVSPGDKVEVGDVIMVLDIDGEKPDQDKTKENDTEKEAVEETSENDEVEIKPDETEDHSKEQTDQTSPTESGEVLALPKVRKLADKKNVDLASIKTGERITEDEVLEAADSSETGTPDTEESSEQSDSSDEEETSEVLATPSVRKLAREKDISLQNIEGSGKGGKVTREDVLAATGKSGNTGQNNSEKHDTGIEGDEKKVEMSQVRKTVADRMEESRFTAPHVTHFDTADITELVELREEKKDKTETHLTYLPFIMKAVHLAMKKHPRINSELDEANESVILKGHYDFNIAVDTDDGLMVPLINQVDEKNIVDLAQEVNKKAEKAREGKLSREEMKNGTFSITNLGVIGGEEFTPIINYPQTAILGIGKIQETAEVLDGEIEPRMTVKLSLSYDHRVIDGADAARFMNAVIENLEDPENMILEL